MNSYEIQELRKDYLSRKDEYERFANLICERLKYLVKNLEIHYYSIDFRIKDVDSFIKKAIRKNFEHPLIEITDQIGIRITTIYQNELDKIDQEISREFHYLKRENKIDSLDYNQLGYLGIHFEVSLQELENLQNTVYNGTVCEIQLHTRAQNLWANISHQLSYKTTIEPSTNVKRSLYRLVSLIEIFDKEVTTAKDAILNQPEIPEVNLLNYLERYFYGFSNKQFDREFSLQNLNILKNLLSQEEIKDFEHLIGEFVESNREKLTQIFNNYSKDGRGSYKILMLFQPESILIFWRLQKDKFKLLNVWEKFLARELLEFMADVWVISLPSQ
jgi:ppGpp synthetase/RelA/SpoT-type nucleotidyltranferase